GVWACAFLLFLSATGITWSTYAGAHVSDLRAAMNWQRPQLEITAPAGAAAESAASEHTGHAGQDGGALDPGTVDLDAVVAAAGGAGVHAPLELSLPTEPGAGVTVTETDKAFRLTTDVAAVDPMTAEVTGVIDYWRDYTVVAMLADWGIRMHMGLLFGLANQLVLFAVAVAIVVMIGLGYRMWWQRRPTRGSAWATGRPPVRGGLRRLPPVAVAPVVLLAAVLGWFVPLLGISLAAFVLVDLVVAAIKRRRAQHLT
ncbi:MAG: peptidase, partial [Mycobacterium sp.]|nr:peptidase [Mycobacterium sp.]